MSNRTEPITAYGDARRTLSFDGETVTITGRSTLWGRYTKRVPLADIAGIQWKDAGVVRGYIRVEQAGSGHYRGLVNQHQQVQRVDQDRDVIAFHRKQQPEFEHVRDMIEQARARANTPPGLGDKLAEIERLYHDGSITHDEWTTIRGQLISAYAVQ